MTPTRSITSLALAAITAVLAPGCEPDAHMERVDRTEYHYYVRIEVLSVHFDVPLLEVREVGWLRNGKKHGQWQKFVDGTLEDVESWVNGRQHGLQLTLWEDGTLWADGMYRHGIPHGRQRTFWDDGSIGSLEWWRKGNPVGIGCEWYPGGKRLERIIRYAHGWRKQEIRDPPGECPLTLGDDARHKDPRNREYTSQGRVLSRGFVRTLPRW